MQEEIKALERQIACCLYKDRHRFRRKLQRIKKQERHGGNCEAALLQLLEQVESSVALRNYRGANVPAVTYPPGLPILGKKTEIIELIQQHQVIVVAGETGSGKTTQLPKFCIESGQGREGKIGCTQPRRVAATSIARYLSQEFSASHSVVYKIRFLSTDSDKALIKFMTDGILLAEMQSDHLLREYDTLIIDEAHERTLNIDFILGNIKQILPRRPDLKVIISSATIDTESFAKFFDDAPIIEVSGRLYPVTVYYNPIDHQLEESGDLTIIDQAVATAQKLYQESSRGDMLVFMPGEADIRETVDKLRGAKWCQAEILPLFGRLTAAEQNRIFTSGERRRIVVATNIAETSLTIPGIRYVIDSGTARISRYCPRSKTKRLPIEAISRSSAQQRQGRCGRVEDGVCVRLYYEEDFLARDQFTAPEIRRSDLAEVILRMAALQMGAIEDFPFIDPPARNAIGDAVNTLRELGALDSKNQLTALGREMAALPIDPRTARILLAAIETGALAEILIIAAALSIQDPRERPFEKASEADERHKAFMDPRSDFLTYLNLWQEYHDKWEQLQTQNKMRKFCRQHFLSYTRMREWCDLHRELTAILKDQKKLRLRRDPAEYDSIHKAILSGFLAHICQKKEKNFFYARQNQELMIFPGSALFNRFPDWVVAAELVETSRLFARTVAQIEMDWIEPLAGHLVNRSYHQPRWDRRSGQVIAKEKVSLWGFVIVAQRPVHYGRIDRCEARNVFIREGLVPGEIDGDFPFLQANLQLIAQVRAIEAKVRKRNLLAEDEALSQFYQERLPDLVNVVELRRHQQRHTNDHRLQMELADVIQRQLPPTNSEDYPDSILLGSQRLRLDYCFAPGDDGDGITLEVPLDTVHQLDPRHFEWLVPGWREEKVLALLKSLSKDFRRRLTPLADRCQEIMATISPQGDSLIAVLEQTIAKRYGIEIQRQDWQLQNLESHLFFRFRVIDDSGKVLATGRDLAAIQEKLPMRRQHPAWEQAQKKWFLPRLRNWCFGELPISVEITPYQGGLPHLGYPGLEIKDGHINRTLFTSSEQAGEHTRRAGALLLEYSLSQELARLERALRFSQPLEQCYRRLGWVDDLPRRSLLCLKRSLLTTAPEVIRSEEQFNRHRQRIRAQMDDLPETWRQLLQEILDRCQEVRDWLQSGRYVGARGYLEETSHQVRRNLEELCGPGLLDRNDWQRLQHYPRYLQALIIRLQRATDDPNRDHNKWQEIVPHLRDLEAAAQVLDGEQHRQLLTEYRWMIEEFKVSVFAQKLKTAQPVSQKKLKQKWEQIENLILRQR